MAFDSGQTIDVYFHATGKSIMSDSSGYSVELEWEKEDLVPKHFKPDMSGETVLIGLKSHTYHLTNLILDIPGQIIVYLDYAGSYRITNCTVTDYDNGCNPSRITWRGVDSLELDETHTRDLLDISDEILERTLWDTRTERFKAYLISLNLYKLV